MSRTLVPLTLDRLAVLPDPCHACVFWELDPVAASRAEQADATAAEKEAWVAATLLEWGSCGQVLLVDGDVAGYVGYAPAAYLPRLASFPTAPISADAVALAGLRLFPGYEDAGLGRMLVQGMAADLSRRGVRAVEAVASAHPGHGGCLVPAGFLLAVGFKTARAHPRTPRLRLDLRAAVRWRDGVVDAALEKLLGVRPPVPALHREPRT